jgi:hypothetical protein
MVAQPLKRGYRTLCLPISEADYGRFMTDKAFAKAHLDSGTGGIRNGFPIHSSGAMRGMGLPNLRANNSYAAGEFD